MCTVVLSFEPEREWQVLIAATRDEFHSRSWKMPKEWWPERFPGIVGGRDLQSGGTWLAVDRLRHRAAVVLNRIEPSAIPAAHAQSRGFLPLLAVAHGLDSIRLEDLRSYKPFNLVCAEPGSVRWCRYDGERLSTHEISSGLHIITSADMDDLNDPHQALWSSAFSTAIEPTLAFSQSALSGWGGWPQLLADRETPEGDPFALNVRRVASLPGYGTLSASLVAVGESTVRFDCCSGPPDSGDWTNVI